MDDKTDEPGSDFSIALALRERDGPPRWIELTAAVDLGRIGPYVEGLLVRRGVEGLLLQPGRADPVRGGRRMYDHASGRIMARRARQEQERQGRGGFWARVRRIVRSIAGTVTTRDRPSPSPRALTDPDTGLPNRLHADAVLQHFVGAARRGEPLTLIMLTLDETPSLFSKGRGDNRLFEVARQMRESTRSADLVARYDPETFVLGLPQCTSTGARNAVRRLRQRLDVSFVAGVGGYGPEASTVESLVATASAALDHARHASN